MSTPHKPDDVGKNSPGSIGRNVAKDFGPFLTLGLQLAISVVVFLFIGYWLDGKFGTSPWCTIGGAFLGAAGGLIKFIREALALGRKADNALRKHGNEKREH
ncbi:MAG: AtpZ/AtpI family protein [Bacteroidetes bacterium]|nr:AtpZ/AtpI family protein [Bacteroidota bacterium]MCW5894629.1 AtpZ/AtpI family protein [Bacteroidota bacterium]